MKKTILFLLCLVCICVNSQEDETLTGNDLLDDEFESDITFNEKDGTPSEGYVEDEFDVAPATENYVEDEFDVSPSESYVEDEFGESSPGEGYVEDEFGESSAGEEYVEDEFGESSPEGNYVEDEFDVSPSKEYVQDEFGDSQSSEEFETGNELVADEFETGDDLVADEFETGYIQDEFSSTEDSSETQTSFVEDEFGVGNDLLDDEFGVVIDEDIQEIDKGNLIAEAAYEEEEEEKLDFTTALLDLDGYIRRKYFMNSFEYFRFTYYSRTQYFWKNNDQNGNERRFQNEFTTRIEFEYKFNENLRFFAAPEVNFDDFNAAEGYFALENLEDNGTRRSYLNYNEMYLFFRVNDIDISFGKRVYAWGKAFGPNPTDVINPYDLIDPIEGFNIDSSRKMGVWSGMVKYYLPNFGDVEFPTLEFIFVPRFTRNREAFEGSKWFIDTPAAVEELLGLAPDTVSQVNELDAHNFQNSQFAFRFSATVKGWDFSLSYYEGVNRFSDFRFDPNNFLLTRFHDQLRIIGADFVTTFGQWRVFFEGVLVDSKTGDSDDFFAVIFGSSRRYINVFREGDSLEGVLQLFFNRLVVNELDANLNNGEQILGFPEESGDRGFTIFSEYKYNTTLSFQLLFSMNLNQDYRWASDFFEARVAYKVHPNLIVSLKTQFLNGLREDIIYGVHRDNDNVSFILDYTF
ncbi:hypothetical protein [Candidatus Uabimicrobium amorphum]|uniref:Uncharacterized protein n=1 Tax=Uabimicrobium amorphum TaxID=2596890 RepID=A0A5S9F1K5_UABAM|nr:hypothetical protein [Candidatus Uabimicrobium amorphum]BBM82291.1 hypothetical protein UABAM_00634 [Candidatus Uabimicrobium amorphum]